MGSPSHIITGGFGNGTLDGSPHLIVTMGYGSGIALKPKVCFDMPRRPIRFDMPRRPVRFDLRKR